MKTQIVVIEENTLGYINPLTPNQFTVLRAKVTGGKSSRYFSYDNDIFNVPTDKSKIRLATKADFDEYRIEYSQFASRPDEYEMNHEN